MNFEIPKSIKIIFDDQTTEIFHNDVGEKWEDAVSNHLLQRKLAGNLNDFYEVTVSIGQTGIYKKHGPVTRTLRRMFDHMTG